MNPNAAIDLPTFEALKESMGPDFIGELVQTYAEETPKLLEQVKNSPQ
jgi:HPt (histidine-containing phosphotransfer) domain-containing protein